MAHEEMMVQASFNDTLPAVDQNRMVSSPPLHFYYLPNDIVDSPQVIALPIRIPVHDVELSHLVDLP